ncbi:hypothetical protein NC651_003111 [Populus alba x Populus x berolinensis]|nr:hypothetical protein NC651_003111 [Populus alba x Populus x berolinensis]
MCLQIRSQGKDARKLKNNRKEASVFSSSKQQQYARD